MNPDQQKPTNSQPAQQTNNTNDLQAMIPTKNKPALIGYYCGVFGLIPFIGLPLSVAGIILGKKGLEQYRSSPTPGAKVHAKIGLYLGLFELIIFALFVAFIIISATRQ